MAKPARVKPKGTYIAQLIAEAGYTPQGFAEERTDRQPTIDKKLVYAAIRSEWSTPQTINTILAKLAKKWPKLTYDHLIDKTVNPGGDDDTPQGDSSPSPPAFSPPPGFVLVGFGKDGTLDGVAEYQSLDALMQSFQQQFKQPIQISIYVQVKDTNSYLIQIAIPEEAVFRSLLPEFSQGELDRLQIKSIHLPYNLKSRLTLTPAGQSPGFFDWLASLFHPVVSVGPGTHVFGGNDRYLETTYNLTVDVTATELILVRPKPGE